jgi:hypothetical protein
MPMPIAEMRDNAQLVADEATMRLDQLRVERSRINEAIKMTLAEKNEAAAVVKKLTPHEKKQVVVEDVAVEDVIEGA